MKTLFHKLFPGYRVWFTGICVCFLSAGWLVSTPTFASLPTDQFQQSIVTLSAYQGGEAVSRGTGFVVQADRYNGYIVTSAQQIRDAESLSVTVPGHGGQLIAQVVRSELSSDFALLKVNGLDLPALEFSQAAPLAGEVVWTAAKLEGSEEVSLSKGLLRRGFKLADEDTGWYQHSAVEGAIGGSVLVNECGHVVGVNFNQPGTSADGSVRAIDFSTLRRLLAAQNVSYTTAATSCVSEVVLARQEAETAAAEARLAQDEAVKAQAVARELESQLAESKRDNDDLLEQMRIARERAEAAIRAAELAQVKADNTRRELEEKTLQLREETQVLLRALEAERTRSNARLEDMLASQQAAAANRDRILIGFSGLLIVLIAVLLLLARYRANGTSTSRREIVADNRGTEMHREELSEYVLDGRDDDGIRYLLRISGDQMQNDDGVVIGRNPKDSPYIINHADVSRKHARIKVKNHRVFIEDLGSTNGTSVNGQSIDDKGLVSVANGDQIIIGSVVMKLRVLEG